MRRSWCGVGCAYNVVCPLLCVAGSGDGTPEQWGPEELTDWATARVSVAHTHM